MEEEKKEDFTHMYSYLELMEAETEKPEYKFSAKGRNKYRYCTDPWILNN